MPKAMRGSEGLAGEMILAGAQVLAPGSTGPGYGSGAAGRAALTAMRRADAKTHGETSRPSPLANGQLGYLAVTDGRLLVMEYKIGAVFKNATALVAEVPRQTVTGASVGDGLLAPVVITFADGTSWHFGVAKAYARGAREVVTLLTD
jgi:hypothetical protein